MPRERRTSVPPTPAPPTVQDTGPTKYNGGTDAQSSRRSQGGDIKVSSTLDENRRRLRALMSRLKWATKESDALGDAFAEFEGVVGDCRVLCDAIVDFEVKKRGGSRNSSGTVVMIVEDGQGVRETRLTDWVAKILERSPGLMEVRDWKETLSRLMGRYRECIEEGEMETSVSESDESFASTTPTPSSNARLQSEHAAIQEAWSHVNKLITFRDPESAEKVEVEELSRQSTGKRSEGKAEETADETPKPLAGFADAVADEATLRKLERLDRQAKRSEAKVERPITEQFDISTRGDTILEFPVTPDDATPTTGSRSFRRASFRVSSHILSEVSPVFAQLFSNAPLGGRKRDDDFQGPYPRAKGHVTKDGVQVKIYRMPPLSAREVSPLEILLHAAHMHNDQVPRTIDFERFVTIAELCFRLQCTSPLEVFVEMRWLPDWVHMGGEAMPDGLLLISYVFGSRGIFTRMTKSAILNVVSEVELESKRWPKELKEKIWAVRNAKMEQLYACCISTIQEYLRPPAQPLVSETIASGPSHRASIFDEPPSSMASSPGSWLVSGQGSLAVPQLRPFSSSAPRCPKGSRECDAANLGYLMIMMSEMQLLPIIMNPAALAHLDEPASQGGLALPRRSLAQVVRMLQTIPSHPNPVHKGVCDPIPAFRASVIDIFNSLSGLTLFDVTGKHGYVLSRGHAREPRKRFAHQTVAVQTTMKPSVEQNSRQVPEGVVVGIIRQLSAMRDISAFAMTNKSFYETYKKYEAALRDPSGRAFMAADQGEDETNGYSTLGPSLPLEEILTEEEARRIIWPESPPRSPAPEVQPSDLKGKSPVVSVASLDGGPLPEGSREKFRAEDAFFTEEKMLCVMDTKQLTAEHDNFVGMYKGQKVEETSQVWV
ncbi:hypothetical protein jhhlp_004068 [Lomentospora prolificans]|uniref:Uncharacterized protein n=1 Tax=Lomentospora prolificans TaxID=41688 RepID=A0A2N3NAP3_9PEZI|nr:hypothetical protein jhhlp_004068 [Lomentospora prolificans]